MAARGGWMAAIFGLSALAVLGFGMGLLAGGLWREPALVLHHLLGETEEVALSAGRASEPAYAAAAPALAKPSPAPPPVAAAPPVGPTGDEAAPPAPLGGGGFAIQVGAFGESGPAQQLAEALRGKGYAARVSPGAAAGQARWRVRVGPFPSREVAERSAARLKTDEKLPTWILSEDEG